MADKAIGDLPAAKQLDPTALLAVEQQGKAYKFTGAQFQQFAKEAVKSQVTQATKSAEEAAKSAEEAKIYKNEAAGSANVAKQYSGKPPIPQNDTWWIWNAEKQIYEDTGVDAIGNVVYATFAIDINTGILMMYEPDKYDGPQFQLDDEGFLEVFVSGRN